MSKPQPVAQDLRLALIKAETLLKRIVGGYKFDENECHATLADIRLALAGGVGK